VGSAGQLVQYLVTPLGSESSSTAKNVAKAVAHPAAMQWATWLDLTILFFLPALVVVAHLARARETRLGWVAAVLAIGTTVPGIAYVLAPDVLYLEAAHGDVSAHAISAYNGAPVVTVATAVFLVGHVLGLILLGVGLWRVGSVPRWAAACLAASPVLEIGGAAANVRPIGVLAYLLLIAAFSSCAAVLAGRDTATAPSAAALARS
jgi:hypothetical protein